MELVQNLSDEELTADIKEAFLHRKNVTPGGIRRLSYDSQFDHCFKAAAELCRKLNACPIVLVDSLFHNSDPDKIFPNFWLTPPLITKKYREFINTHYTKAAVLFPVLLKLLKSQLDAGRTLEEALLSDYLNFPAWFRVGISKEPIPTVMRKYLAAAVIEMNFDIKQLIKDKNLDIRRYGL